MRRPDPAPQLRVATFFHLRETRHAVPARAAVKQRQAGPRGIGHYIRNDANRGTPEVVPLYLLEIFHMRESCHR